MRQKAGKCADVHRAVSRVDNSRSERKQGAPGYMTVYLALVMGILLSPDSGRPDGGQNLYDSNVYRVLCGYGIGFCTGGISSGNAGSV